MKLPIPDDWNGEDWSCFQIQWPNSRQYNAILAGFLSFLTRGRVWDEKTGSIRDVQEIGWQIVNKNWKLPTCDSTDQPIEPPSPGEYPCWRAYEDMDTEDCIMGCYVEDVRCLNGKFQVKRCGEWEDVESCNQDGWLTEPSDESIAEPENPVQAENWRCSKATTIAHAIFLVASRAIDNINSLTFIHTVETETGLNLNNWQMWNLQKYLLAASAVLEDFAEALTAERLQDFTCRLFQKLDGSNNDIGENQWQIIRDEIWAMYREFPLEFTLMSSVQDCIGLQTMRSLTRVGVYITEGVCCPPESEITAEYDWAHSIDFTEGNLYDWQMNGTGVQMIAGQGVVVTPAAYGDRLAGVQKALPTPAPDGFNFTFMQVEFSAWPQGSGTTSYWFKLGSDVMYSDNGMYGKPKVSLIMDKTVSQGQPIEIAWNSTLGNPPSGSHKLTRIIYAGKGTDPWPTDPAYAAKG